MEKNGNQSLTQPLYHLKLTDIVASDPFIVTDPETGLYYLYSNHGEAEHGWTDASISCYQSEDLVNWAFCSIAFDSAAAYEQNWAPEVNCYNGSFYMFASLKETAKNGRSDLRGCYILKADRPCGPFEAYSERITPKDWQCLDAHLYIDEKGTPYMLYCHEWITLPDDDGEICAVELSKDLKSAVGEHKLLFKGKNHPFSDNGVTDGPFVYKAGNGDLVMLWSKYIGSTYVILSSRSGQGILGPWVHDEKALFTDDGGHAMLFRDFSGALKIAFHTPNYPHTAKRAYIYDFIDDNGNLSIQLGEPNTAGMR